MCIANICYSNNKADECYPGAYDDSCLLQLSLNWI